MTIDIDNDRYVMTQTITDRHSSYYDNILQIMDVISLAGNHLFTCSVSNLAGSTSQDISTTLRGKQQYSTAYINVITSVWTETGWDSYRHTIVHSCSYI